MRASGYLFVACVFVTVALLTFVAASFVGWDVKEFPLLMAAMCATIVGIAVWHRQSPSSEERFVKFGLGILLAVTEICFSIIMQSTVGWLKYPEVSIPIAAVGCLIFPYAIGGDYWKALWKSKLLQVTGSATIGEVSEECVIRIALEYLQQSRRTQSSYPVTSFHFLEKDHGSPFPRWEVAFLVDPGIQPPYCIVQVIPPSMTTRFVKVI